MSPPSIDFSWKPGGGKFLPQQELERWEQIIRDAMGGSGWVVMRQVNDVWHVEEARVYAANLPAETSHLKEQGDRRPAVREALRAKGKKVGD